MPSSDMAHVVKPDCSEHLTCRIRRTKFDPVLCWMISARFDAIPSEMAGFDDKCYPRPMRLKRVDTSNNLYKTEAPRPSGAKLVNSLQSTGAARQ
jgi:hypothetical protein